MKTGRAERIRDWLGLSNEEIAGAMAYIHAHREEVEKTSTNRS